VQTRLFSDVVEFMRVNLESRFSMTITIERYCAMDTPVFMRCLLIRLELDLGDGLPEVFAMGCSDLKLEVGHLAGAVGTSKGASAPRRP